MTGYTFKPSGYPTDNGMAAAIDAARKTELAAERRRAHPKKCRSGTEVCRNEELLRWLGVKRPGAPVGSKRRRAIKLRRVK